MAFRGSKWAVLGLLAACSKASEPDRSAEIVRPTLEILPDGRVLTERGAQKLEDLTVEELAQLFHVASARQQPELSESQRDLLVEYEAIRALYEQEPGADGPRAPSPSLPNAKDSDAPVFTGLATREHEIWLHYGTDVDRYTVKTRDGKVLASQIDDVRLWLDFPELHELVHNAVDLLDY